MWFKALDNRNTKNIKVQGFLCFCLRENALPFLFKNFSNILSLIFLVLIFGTLILKIILSRNLIILIASNQEHKKILRNQFRFDSTSEI